jgi:hypothetical protein
MNIHQESRTGPRQRDVFSRPTKAQSGKMGKIERLCVFVRD